MSSKTLPEQQRSNETEGKDAKENKHPYPHLSLILLISYVAIDACLIRTDAWLHGQLDRPKADSTMLVGLDFPCC